MPKCVRRRPQILEARQNLGSSDARISVAKWCSGIIQEDGSIWARRFRALPGSWIVRGERRRFTVHSPEDFAATFKMMEDE